MTRPFVQQPYWMMYELTGLDHTKDKQKPHRQRLSPHQLHAPRSVLNVTCEALDWWVGCYSDDDVDDEFLPMRPLRADACDPNPESDVPETDD
jgi:hypothetical protein